MVVELDIRRALRPHFHRFDNGCMWKDAFDRALAYAAENPHAALDAVISFALQPDRPTGSRYRTMRQLARRRAA